MFSEVSMFTPVSAAFDDEGALIQSAGFNLKKELADDPKTSGNIVLRKSGFTARQLRNRKLIQAMSKPEAYLDEYQKKVEDIAEDIGKSVNNDIQTLLNMGYDAQEAQEIAANKAENEVRNKMLMLNLQYPMAENEGLLASAAGKFDVRGTFLHGKKSKKEIKDK